jgi:drug/metabolite transporter (DMT)-like permease
MRVTVRATTATAAPETDWRVWAALSIVYVVWGSTYLAIAYLVDSLPPMLTGGVRFVTAGSIMVIVAVARSGTAVWETLTWRTLLAAGIVGTLLATGGNGLVMLGETHIASGLAALIVAAVPMWVVLFRRFSGDRVKRVTLVGVLCGFVGVALLLLPGGGGHAAPAGFFIVLAASLCWSTGSFTASKLEMPSDPFLSTGVQMCLGGLVGIAIGLIAGDAGKVHASSFDSDAVIAFAYLVLVGSVIAYTAYAWLLRNAPVSKVVTYAYVNPVIAIVLGALFRDESITLTVVLGAVIIVGSVAAVVRTESS